MIHAASGQEIVFQLPQIIEAGVAYQLQPLAEAPGMWNGRPHRLRNIESLHGMVARRWWWRGGGSRREHRHSRGEKVVLPPEPK